MRNKFQKVAGPVILLALPFLAYAQLDSNYTVKGILTYITQIITKFVIPILISACVAVFIWGIVRFIFSAGNSEEVHKSKNLIIWGLVGIFALFCFWGIIVVLFNTFYGASAPPSSSGVTWPFRAMP